DHASANPYTYSLTSPTPPPATLCPYTTLFRSRPRQLAQPAQLEAQRPAVAIEREPSLLRARGAEDARHLFLVARRGTDDAHLQRDRKSTRLNSSHVAISYAVFCLKKKNTPEHQ